MSQPQKKQQTDKSPIPFIDLKAQQRLIRRQVDEAIARVLDHGAYIMGPEVGELEKQLAAFCGVKHAISCANGTDALALGLMAKNVRPGDAIFVPSFTFAATAEVVAWLGAKPVFIDSVPDTFNICPQSLRDGIAKAKSLGLKPRGIIPVDLFGLAADYDAIQTIADEFDLWVLADAAQSFGATYKGRKAGNIGDIATTSFFPAKPLGCYGDGGAIFTNDDKLASVITSMRIHGQGSDKYDNVRIGMNGRLDTVQAAILMEKLKIFPQEIASRQKTAEFYNDALKAAVQTPVTPPSLQSIWAQYTIILPQGTDRPGLIEHLKSEGVPAVVYYIKPLHHQLAYKSYPVASDKGLPVCEDLANRVLSLPMSGYISAMDAERIVSAVLSGLKA